jgi:hypothetical protein
LGVKRESAAHCAPYAHQRCKCLACHDTPDTAPRTLVERYGNANGFGWKLNDILTAQIVSAPMEREGKLDRAKQGSKTSSPNPERGARALVTCSVTPERADFLCCDGK